ncbi:hypothetical protein [Streptomyces sp. NBC_00470]|uniref:hypothetical protein n=1 Tax=Streptomyces sp. NBC_00470 TaxID=2975753 RepID=UPI0030E599E5
MATYRKEVRETYNLGNYEQIQVAAAVEFTDDDDFTDETLQQQLDDLMSVERQRAWSLTTTRNSFVNHHPSIEKDNR